ncbi:PKD domain-containing protein [Flammeovirga sp. SJP92]|uniref:PKD domain-containing protein n=1 Tax=Flammeovirga sp. SJP92 TaxID=1775430 RepID=UPI000786CBA3|nr:PKD domain-containing protein [Flammeovirga sp. SJP92]KXX67694.1 hypothetical protein AVL50_24800 [Flammeovirga sp. SJP92]
MKIKNYYLIGAFLFGLTACSSDDEGVTATAPKADFSYTVSDSQDGTVTFTESCENTKDYVWDFGDGSATTTEPNPTHKYDETGNYDVSLTAIGEASSDMITKEVAVTIEAGSGEPTYGENLVKGSEMDNEADWTFRQVWDGEGNEVLHQFKDGKFVFNIPEGNEYSQSYLYQEITGLEAGKTYKFNAHVKGAGTSAIWFETYFTNLNPADSDLEGQARVYLSSFGEEGSTCIVSEFDGDINEVSQQGCASADESPVLINADGTFTLTAEELTESGSFYLAFKVGSGWGEVSFGNGVELDNISIVEVMQ